MQPFVEEGDGIIFFLQEAEFSRCASIGSRMCDGEDISSIEIIEILQILRDIGELSPCISISLPQVDPLSLF